MLGASAKAGVGAAGIALIGCGDDDDDASSTTTATTTAAEQVEQAAEQAEQTVAELEQGSMPGELTPAQEAADLSIEEELRLRYHGDKLMNLPGQADGPQYGGRWTWGSTDPGTWDPLGATGALLAAFALYFYNQLVSFPLGDFDPNNRVDPQGDLATGWETPDPETWVFNVDHPINWADVEPVNGRPMTMDDIRLGYGALAEAPVQARDYGVIKSIEGDESGRTVRFNLTEPAPYLLNVMITPYHVIVPPEVIGTERLATWPVGSGPFMLDELESGVRWFAPRNPDYFRKDPRTGLQLPYVDELEGLDNLGQREATVSGWATGDQFQIIAEDLVDLEEFQGLQPNAVTVATAPPPGWQGHVIFKLKEAPWNDIRVRTALSLLINRPELSIGVFNGFAAAGIGMDWTFFADESGPGGLREWPWTFDELAELGGASVFDPAGAIAMLDAAGFNSDNPLKFDIDFHSLPISSLRLFELTVDQWNSNGGGVVEATLNRGEWLGWFGKLPTGDFKDLLGHYQYGPAQDPDQYTYGPMHSESPGNFYQIDDAEIDEWSQAQRTEVDTAKRQDLWTKILSKDLAESWRLWLVNPYRLQLRREFMFNHSDTYNAWNPGWGEKGAELVWIHKQMRANA